MLSHHSSPNVVAIARFRFKSSTHRHVVLRNSIPVDDKTLFFLRE